MLTEQERINISIKDSDIKKVLSLLKQHNLEYELIEQPILEPVYPNEKDHQLAQQISKNIEQGKERLISWNEVKETL